MYIATMLLAGLNMLWMDCWLVGLDFIVYNKCIIRYNILTPIPYSHVYFYFLFSKKKKRKENKIKIFLPIQQRRAFQSFSFFSHHRIVVLARFYILFIYLCVCLCVCVYVLLLFLLLLLDQAGEYTGIRNIWRMIFISIYV